MVVEVGALVDAQSSKFAVAGMSDRERSSAQIDVWVVGCPEGEHSDQLVATTRAALASSKPLIVLVNPWSSSLATLLLDDGADDVQEAQIDPAELAARILAMDRRTRRVSLPTFGCGALIVDPSTRCAQWGSNALPLSRRSFDLLYALMAAYPAAVSTRELRKLVWRDSDGNGQLRGVVWKLRQVLMPALGPGAIVAVDNTSYCLALPVIRICAASA